MNFADLIETTDTLGKTADSLLVFTPRVAAAAANAQVMVTRAPVLVETNNNRTLARRAHQSAVLQRAWIRA